MIQARDKQFRLPALSLRGRILGGFAVVLVLLVTVASGALTMMSGIHTEAARVGRDSAAATVADDLALQVADAHARVAQYALTASLDDQRAAQASLARLAQGIEHNRKPDGEIGGLAERYRTAVDTTISAVERRRAAVERLREAETELHTIISALVQLGHRDADPALAVALTAVLDNFAASATAASHFVASRTPADEDTAATALGALRPGLDALAQSAASNRRMQRLVTAAAEPLNRFADGLKALVTADDQLQRATVERDAAAASVLAASADTRNQAVASLGGAISLMLHSTASAYQLGLAAFITAVAVGLALAFAIGSGIARPVRHLTATMRRLADGDLSAAIPHSGRRDELGEMARAVQVFRDHMQHGKELAEQQGTERRRAEADKRAALATMAETIETETRQALIAIGHRTAAMASTADEMHASADRTGALAGSAAAAAAQALSNAQTVASAAEQLAASIREIGSRASQSIEVVGRAVAVGNETRGSIETLNQEVERISSVAEMIGEIAARTNLLALNATIEAARAGDAGKGFAVVASEVKALATQTARSTEDITHHIDQVRAATEASVAAVRRIEQTITEVDAIAGSIAAAVEQQGSATAEIARNVAETASAAHEMTSRTGEVSQEAVETGRRAVAVRESTTVLNTAMEELRHSVIRVVRTAIPEVERRRAARQTADLPVRISTVGQPEVAARTTDLSEGGARIVGGPSLPAGTEAKLRIDGIAAALPAQVRANVGETLHVAFNGEVKAVRALLDRADAGVTPG